MLEKSEHKILNNNSFVVFLIFSGVQKSYRFVLLCDFIKLGNGFFVFGKFDFIFLLKFNPFLRVVTEPLP